MQLTCFTFNSFPLFQMFRTSYLFQFWFISPFQLFRISYFFQIKIKLKVSFLLTVSPRGKHRFIFGNYAWYYNNNNNNNNQKHHYMGRLVALTTVGLLTSCLSEHMSLQKDSPPSSSLFASNAAFNVFSFITLFKIKAYWVPPSPIFHMAHSVWTVDVAGSNILQGPTHCYLAWETGTVMEG